MYLQGSEDVLRAGHNMVNAAADMKRAADSIESSLFRHGQQMEEWLSRFEAAVEKMVTASEQSKKTFSRAPVAERV
jgi:hypothetical protein